MSVFEEKQADPLTNLRALEHSILGSRTEYRDIREVLEKLAVLNTERGTHVISVTLYQSKDLISLQRSIRTAVGDRMVSAAQRRACMSRC